MSSRTESTAGSPTYELSCNDCAFETTVTGSVIEALDVADEHQEEHGRTPYDHFVNFKRQEEA